MAHALRLAARGLGRTWPNPAVGCVILRDGRILGRGWTQPGGRPHAEVMALRQAGAAAAGATAYVSLEPCAHHGKTPPCAEALVAAGIARVVSAATDPDPRVSGRGHAILRAAGIAVTENVLRDQAERLNEGFFRRVLGGTPHVTLKLAMSVDGRIANAAGASKWVTGPAARARVHAMRATHDAVMVGIGTALADDPELTVRGLGVAHQPVRIVLDGRLRLPPGGRLARSAASVPVWLVHDEAVPVPAPLADAGVTTIPCRTDAAGRIDIGAALHRLAERGLTRIFSEGGAGVAAALLAGNHVGELVAFTAGHVFGANGTPGTGPLAAGPVLDDPGYLLDRAEQVGADLMQVWRPRRHTP
ncbi:MAG: bifunctional diaminohydroxyphosphoribosylaminopyrimidine deaminase/5-amino-6-(5-phosphoribosylamino)uracil reductase RibD [Paracoccaceae bacterium]|nr:MAG: bifunctional diaminohydroxyphosphoribosylaminopyrimidine deaminase/5-amino-6-(5-phosphoribosylamino)uracil reductase RibD [Paracoccaceae bacterium]